MKLLATNGKFWQPMTNYDNKWQILAINRNFLQQMQLLALNYNFWQQMATFGNKWQLFGSKWYLANKVCESEELCSGGALCFKWTGWDGIGRVFSVCMRDPIHGKIR